MGTNFNENWITLPHYHIEHVFENGNCKMVAILFQHTCTAFSVRSFKQFSPKFLANFPWQFSQSNWKNEQQHSSLAWLRYGCLVWVQNRIFIAILWECIALDKINSAVICSFSRLLWSESCLSCHTLFTALYVMHYWYRHATTTVNTFIYIYHACASMTDPIHFLLRSLFHFTCRWHTPLLNSLRPRDAYMRR